MKSLIETVVQAADAKKAYEIVTLDMEGISGLTDYFVICHGNSDKQVQAIAREMKDEAEKLGATVKRFEGFDEARWVLVDMGDVVAHVFLKDERPYYNLEKLWGDAKHVEMTIGE
ncbi:MAG: ribosome silencing factor [Bacilli bacterium]